MRRRRFLARVALFGGIGLAGCVRDAAPGGSDTDRSPTATDTDGSPSEPTTTNGATTTASPAGTDTPAGVTLADTSFTPGNPSCGQQRNDATVEFVAEGNDVRVDGTIWGSDTCATAELADARYDAGADRLTVHVVTGRRETTETVACAECIVEIDYEVVADFTGGLPDTVRVVHGRDERRTVVTTATRG